MKAISIITLILIFVAAGLGVKVYLENREKPLEYPVHRTLTSADGRSLEVVIFGRSLKNLSIERLSDGQRFDLPIANLDTTDRKFAELLPVTKDDSEVTASVAEEPANKIVDSFIQSRLDAISNLKLKRAALTNEIESGSLSDLIAKNRKKQLKSADAEIRSLQSAITQYKYRNKID